MSDPDFMFTYNSLLGLLDQVEELFLWQQLWIDLETANDRFSLSSEDQLFSIEL